MNTTTTTETEIDIPEPPTDTAMIAVGATIAEAVRAVLKVAEWNDTLREILGIAGKKVAVYLTVRELE